jgi:hypothetical protein
MPVLRIYLNTSALNRPFDDLSSERVRLEADAVAALLAAIEAGRIELVGSEYLDFEISQTPDPERAYRVRALLRGMRAHVRISPSVVARAHALEKLGFRGLDALHLAAAEAGGAAVLATTDDRMIRRAERARASLNVRVVSPAEALRSLSKEQRE